MDESALYKRMCFRAKEIQEAWIPQAGDFWHCACGHCLTSNSIWIIERADLMAIDPKYTFEYMKLNFTKEIVSQVMISRDCGFGPFWFTWKVEKELGHAWLPRFDQLLNFAKQEPSLGKNDAWRFNDFSSYILKNRHNFNEDASLEQLALSWIMEKVYNKKYKENADNPIICDDSDKSVLLRDDFPDDMKELYALVHSSKKRCGGGWFEIKG